jgi:hypothetical protein
MNISDLILDFLFGVVSAIVSIFPTFTIPNGPGFTALAAANFIIPFDVLFFWLGVTLSVGIVGLLYWLFMVVVNLIRGSGA